jgi:hypothetical protein
MSRKHFNAIAESIRNMDITPKAKEKVARNIALALKNTNDRFDMLRFVEACTTN